MSHTPIRTPMYNKTISLSQDMMARWTIHAALTGASFNGFVTQYLDQTLPRLEANPEQEGRP